MRCVIDTTSADASCADALYLLAFPDAKLSSQQPWISPILARVLIGTKTPFLSRPHTLTSVVKPSSAWLNPLYASHTRLQQSSCTSMEHTFRYKTYAFTPWNTCRLSTEWKFFLHPTFSWTSPSPALSAHPARPCRTQQPSASRIPSQPVGLVMASRVSYS